ncbi:hypothetical protein EFL81_10115 [Weissella confusa]|uniref:hypothetical protein n=1 Tax=Weissella confusa TaxID=1583 RepID=UPI00223C20D5|nr:hypothetical protein [Weissella confusa]MCS9997159.1 hypothetical protein [Weissella confusa]
MTIPVAPMVVYNDADGRDYRDSKYWSDVADELKIEIEYANDNEVAEKLKAELVHAEQREIEEKRDEKMGSLITGVIILILLLAFVFAIAF